MQMSGFSKAYMKSCLSEFVTGVTVITTVSQSGSMHGITVNSFNSVSLVPPMILFSIEKSAARFEIFNSCSRFIVNILSDKQKNISQDFSEHDVQNWDDFDYSVIDGIPVISGVISYIYCTKKHVYDGGDHKIIVGHVVHCLKLSKNDKPLIYYKGKYMVVGSVL